METPHTSHKLQLFIGQKLTLPINKTNCLACDESIQFIEKKIESREPFMLAITFKEGSAHYHAMVSPVQVEKLNNEFKILT